MFDHVASSKFHVHIHIDNFATDSSHMNKHAKHVSRSEETLRYHGYDTARKFGSSVPVVVVGVVNDSVTN